MQANSAPCGTMPLHFAEELRFLDDFNTSLAPHESHDTPLAAAMRLAGLLQTLQASPRGRSGLARSLHLLASDCSSQPAPFHYDFAVPWTRLALADAGTLLRLCDCFGLVLHNEKIARCIWRDCVRTIKSRFGDDGYLFALKRAGPFFGAKANRLLQLFATFYQAPQSTAELCDLIQQQGHLGLALSFRDAPYALRLRLALKLPAGVLDAPDSLQPEQELLDRARELLLQLMTREVAPQWANCLS